MGITIHYRAVSGNVEHVLASTAFVRLLGAAMHAEVVEVNEPVMTREQKVLDMNGKVMAHFPLDWTLKTWEKNGGDAADFKVNATREGVLLNFAPPVNTESFRWVWTHYRGRYHIRDFCKTQVFRDDETANLIAHVIIVAALHTIRRTWLPSLRIQDEGEFAGKWDFAKLTEAHTGLRDMILALGKTLQSVFGDKVVTPAEQPGQGEEP